MGKSLDYNIIEHFADVDKLCFSTKEVYTVFPDKNEEHVKKRLHLMVENGLLLRLKKGLYYIIPRGMDSQTFIPDWHLVADYLMKEKDYYIGYGSALQIHGLTVQPHLREIIVTRVQVKPNTKTIQGQEFLFIHHTNFFGYTETWIDDHNKVKCSTLEKTLADALNRPQYCGGIEEVARAMYKCKDKISTEKLIKALIQNESKAATKRYLFLYDLLELGDTSSYHLGLFSKIGSGISLLDSTLPDEGKIDSKYSLRINHDLDTIKDSIYT